MKIVELNFLVQDLVFLDLGLTLTELAKRR